jgi:ABC-type transport system involved in multi-copper enzyme maturation permease subunit
MIMSRPSLRRLVLVELRKSSDTRAGRWLLRVLAIVAILGVVLLLILGKSGDKDFGGFVFTAQLPMGLLLPVLGILAMTGEWSQRSALTTFALVPNRSRVVLAKLLGLVALALALVASSLVTAAIATLIASASGSGSGQWGGMLAIIGRAGLFECLTVLVGAAFGLALLNAPSALVAFFLLPSVLTGLVSLIRPLREPVTWLNLVDNITNLLGNDLNASGWGRIAVSVAVWGALPLAFGTLRVQRRDIS